MARLGGVEVGHDGSASGAVGVLLDRAFSPRCCSTPVLHCQRQHDFGHARRPVASAENLPAVSSRRRSVGRPGSLVCGAFCGSPQKILGMTAIKLGLTRLAQVGCYVSSRTEFLWPLSRNALNTQRIGD